MITRVRRLLRPRFPAGRDLPDHRVGGRFRAV